MSGTFGGGRRVEVEFLAGTRTLSCGVEHDDFCITGDGEAYHHALSSSPHRQVATMLVNPAMAWCDALRIERLPCEVSRGVTALRYRVNDQLVRVEITDELIEGD